MGHVRKIRPDPNRQRANRPWTSDERDRVIDLAPPHLALPIAIGRWTGLREGDVLRLTKTAYNGANIRTRTAKRGIVVSIPVAGPLKSLIEAAPPHNAITLCANSRGQPWTESGFRASFFKFVRRLVANGAVETGLTFHGLRHSVATELRELGFDTRTIADLLGQKTLSVAEHYSREADLTMKLKEVIERLEESNRRRTKVSRKSR